MNRRPLFVLLCSILWLFSPVAAQSRITTPKEQFGFNIGDDYKLATYTQLGEYWQKLARESGRMKLVEIGKSAEGRPIYMAIITSPDNLKRLDHYREISRRLALAEGLSDDQARALAVEGRAVVWIDGGLHATETLGAQQLIETVYQLTSRTDPETLRFLNDVIILCTLVNPDGMELVSGWYMRESEPSKRNLSTIPRLYQKYIGHDDNRDFYMSTQPETEAINRVFFHEWFPQIVYNHHQTGPPGTVIFAPPFRDPFNYNFDPLIPIEIDLVGAAMHARFIAEGKPGATMRSGSNYSTWWNGGLRTTVYFHNMVGLLTEAIGNPTPTEIPFVPSRELPKADLPFPIAPQKWHFRQSIEYEITANRAVLDVASKHREEFLFNIYRMGKNSIERGSRDTWTVDPKMIEEVQAALAKERGNQGEAPANSDTPPDSGAGFRPAGVPLKYFEMLREPAKRDPRGYIIPSDQPDFLTATKFVNALIKNGITIHRATSPFQAAGRNYPAGSFVVKTAQAFRPHIIDMFEPQDHPNDFAYPGGPPIPPYDNAGWTLAFQMGIKFDRVLDGFDGPFEKIEGFAKPVPFTPRGAAAPAGYFLSHEINDSFVAINRLLAAGDDVYWMKNPVNVNGRRVAPGAIYIPARSSTGALLKQLGEELGLPFEAVASRPSGEALKLRPPRIGLWDQYGGSIPSGWIRWLLEQYGFKFTVVYPAALDAGELNTRFDVLIFPDGAIPLREVREGRGGGQFGRQPDAESIPPEFRSWLGRVTTAKTVPQLRKFLDSGGTILALGRSANLAYLSNLPITNALVERTNGVERPLPREKFYVPGSVLEVSVDNTQPLGYGIGERLDVFFDNSPVFRLRPEAAIRGSRPVAWFDSDKPLRSGWAWGQEYLLNGIAVIDAAVGKGKLLLFGPEITFRAQPHASFKFLFNGILYGPAEQVMLK